MLLKKKIIDKEIIKGMKYNIEKNKVVFRWFWPFELESVYVHKVLKAEELNVDYLDIDVSRIYTREEYKTRECYIEKTAGVGEFTYAIYPIAVEEDEKILLDQTNHQNKLLVCEGKIDVFYDINEKKNFFSSKKEITISINSRTALDKNILCYVKNIGCPPSHINDGVRFNLSRNIYCGSDRLTNITIGKNEFIEVFITNEDYSKNYNLVRNKGGNNQSW